MKQERIVCAAVRFVRVSERTDWRSNIDALCIRYDDECIKDLRKKLERSLYSYTEREILGFKTNRNRFVNQKEALEIAKKSCRELWARFDAFINEDGSLRNYLKPEDLY